MQSGQATRRDIVERTFKFGVSIVKIISSLPKAPAGYAVSNQIVRSGTSIGANIEEAQDGLTRKDFIHSMNIALKEARETKYWLKIILESELIPIEKLDNLLDENIQIIRILTTIVKNSRKS